MSRTESSGEPGDVLERWYERLVGTERVPEGRLESQHGDSQSAEAPPPAGPTEDAQRAPAGSPTPESTDTNHPEHTLLVSVARQMMACEFEVLLNQYQYPHGIDAAWEALDEVQRLEQLLSVYQPSSELSKLNQFGAQRAVKLSYDTTLLLELALDLWRLTDGAFDITAGALSEAWGFSRRQGRMPTEQEVREAMQKVGSKWLEVNPLARTGHLLRPGVRVNPGGIGKGFALDRASRKLAAVGVRDYAFHGGKSSVIARGDRLHPDTGGGWLITLNHPLREQEKLGVIRLRNQALGTSGSGKQFFHYGGKRYSHIIDPRTGWPADEMLSATVVCPSGAVADALATALFVMGTESAARFCAQHRSVQAILVSSAAGQVRIDTFNLDDETWDPDPRYAKSDSTR